jgi:hypothetical protein
MMQFILFQTLESWYNSFCVFVSVNITVLEYLHFHNRTEYYA